MSSAIGYRLRAVSKWDPPNDSGGVPTTPVSLVFRRSRSRR